MNQPPVAVLGAGALGAAIAVRLGDTGHHVTLWNRTPDRARAAAAVSTGVTAVTELADAVRNVRAILTLLRELGELAGAHKVAYLDAPVSGSTGPARNGALGWLVSGSQDAFDRAEPTLRQLGSAVEHLGTGVEGSAIKVAVNAWMTTATVAMSDVLSLCDALGIDHEVFTKVLEDGPLKMPYALQKLTAMDGRAYIAGFAVELARKDLTLAEKALPPTPLLRAVGQRLDQTIADGHAHDDLAAVDNQRTLRTTGRSS